jgi:hypothetical protein
MRYDVIQAADTGIGCVKEIVIIWQFRRGYVSKIREKFLSFGLGFEISVKPI